MSNYFWKRLGAASGILYVMLLLAPDVIRRGLEEEPTMTTAEVIAHSCATTTAAQFTDGIIPILHRLGYLFFLFFLGSLWSALRRAEGDDGWLSAAAFGGGLVYLAILFSGDGAGIAAARNACAGIDPQLWQVLDNIGSASYFSSFIPLAILSAASAVVAIRFGALPRWLGWMSAVVAVALLVDGFAWTIYTRNVGAYFILFYLWTVITSIVLIRRAGDTRPAASSASVTPPSVVS